ncbi:MAG: DegT/DnrJ/EryC1/StrS family aminotransferase [Candidatus Krumholzibacteriota bacterium]|nr:DegT/DnrJ/EryC1/StrS family aminotransferase [Candidatus Krumholzibacteriota bacterium]
MNNIPFFNLTEGISKVRDEIDGAIAEVIDNSAFVLGPGVERFESDFADYCGVKGCAGTSSGTTALQLALTGFGIGRGDEVITVPNTFIATVEAIAITGAKPVLVDVLEDTALIDPAKLEEAVTPETKAIIPVHLFGQCCDMDPVMETARKHGLKVIEDSCQAHGAQYKGRKAGSLGDAAAFSFYPSKNLGAFGEGGAVTSEDEEFIDRIKALRHHGQLNKNEHSILGYNYRLPAIQAAVLRVKLKHLDEANSKRRDLAKRYRDNLEDLPLWFQHEQEECNAVYHLFPIGYMNKPELTEALDRSQIGWGEHYPLPVHLHPVFSDLGYSEGSFPVAEGIMKMSITLPMFPELEFRQVDKVCEVIRSVLSG